MNGLAERTIGILLSMTRATLAEACAPQAAAGECAQAMAYILNRLPSGSGSRLTREERWRGKRIPDQLKRIRVWGCAAYLHLPHGDRGTVGNKVLQKFAPRAVLTLFVGYDPHGMGYRVATIPGFKIHTSVHVTFVEDSFPCKTLVPRQVQQESVTANLLAEFPDEGARMGPRGRPTRGWKPSAAALEAIAAGPSHPPESDSEADPDQAADSALMTIEGTINDAAEAYLDTVYTSAHQNAPKTLPEALTGPDRERWLKAFTREYEQHVKLKTMGPPSGCQGSASRSEADSL